MIKINKLHTSLSISAILFSKSVLPPPELKKIIILLFNKNLWFKHRRITFVLDREKNYFVLYYQCVKNFNDQKKTERRRRRTAA
jgi:hypothetical protein